MPEVTYISVTWTAGDVITEAKMDNMVSNDRAVDAMNNGVRMTDRADPATPPATTLHLYVKDSNGTSALFYIDDAGTVHQLTETQPVFVFPFAGTLIVANSVTSALISVKTSTIVKAYGYVKTAPVGANIIIDILKNSGSIWNSNPSNRLTILAGAQSANQTSFDVTSLAEGDTLTMNIAQIGSTTPGADLTVELKTK